MSRLYILVIFTISTILFGCSNSSVEVSGLGIQFEGLSLDKSLVKQASLNSVSVSGKCKNNVEKLLYRYDGQSTWQEVSSSAFSNVKIECKSKGTFSFSVSGGGAESIKLFLKGEGPVYDTNEVTFIAQQGIATSGGDTISGGSFVIKGQVVASAPQKIGDTGTNQFIQGKVTPLSEAQVLQGGGYKLKSKILIQ